MPWQTTIETGRYISLAYAAENTAFLSTKPITGGVIDWTDNASGGTTNGWTDPGFKFTEDDFGFENNEGNPIQIWAPTNAQKTAIIRDEAQVPSSINVKSYEAMSKVYTFATNVTEATGVFTFTASHSTRRALIMEVQGLGALYMPSVEISANVPEGGVKTLTTQDIKIDIFAGTSVTTGFQVIQWQDS